MSDSEINITYETLFELLRLEKNRSELQKLDNDFYTHVSKYIKEKEQIFKKEDKDQETILQQQIKQISNIKHMVRNIYFRRLKKIINIAMNVNLAPDSMVEKEAMLEDEKEFFESILKTLSSNKKILLDPILLGKMPTSIVENESNSEENDNIVVRFIHEVPKFVGTDLQQYGPYKPDDMANLPKELADILIGKGRVEQIEDSG